MDKLTLNYQEIVKRLDECQLPSFDIVIGIARGGIVPSVMAAYKLKTDVKVVKISYRDDDNQPLYDEPKVIHSVLISQNVKKILLVDNVSVTGKTLKKAKELFRKYQVKTLVFKGKEADFILFPEITSCVNWPWDN